MIFEQAVKQGQGQGQGVLNCKAEIGQQMGELPPVKAGTDIRWRK